LFLNKREISQLTLWGVTARTKHVHVQGHHWHLSIYHFLLKRSVLWVENWNSWAKL